MTARKSMTGNPVTLITPTCGPDTPMAKEHHRSWLKVATHQRLLGLGLLLLLLLLLLDPLSPISCACCAGCDLLVLLCFLNVVLVQVAEAAAAAVAVAAMATTAVHPVGNQTTAGPTTCGTKQPTRRPRTRKAVKKRKAKQHLSTTPADTAGSSTDKVIGW